MTQTTSQSHEIYRVDKFEVPRSARGEFLARIHETHALLRTLPGFERDFVLEQTGGPGTFNFVTIVEWENAEVLAGAKEAVAARHAEGGFDPGRMFEGLGIVADLANYREVAIRT